MQRIHFIIYSCPVHERKSFYCLLSLHYQSILQRYIEYPSYSTFNSQRFILLFHSRHIFIHVLVCLLAQIYYSIPHHSLSNPLPIPFLSLTTPFLRPYHRQHHHHHKQMVQRQSTMLVLGLLRVILLGYGSKGNTSVLVS